MTLRPNSESPMAGAAVRYLEQLAEQEDVAVSLRRYWQFWQSAAAREGIWVLWRRLGANLTLFLLDGIIKYINYKEVSYLYR